MRTELGVLNEIKENYEEYNKTLPALFIRGYINDDVLSIKDHE